MDELIKRFETVADRDLKQCAARGVAYQADMSRPVQYDDAYFQNYVNLEGQEIARRLNAGRVDLVNRHAGADGLTLDVGIGSGEFIKSRGANTFGRDVNPRAVEWLKQENLFSEDMGAFKAFTFWDVLEHIDVPNNYFKRMPEGSLLFTSLPTFDDLNRVRKSRHYKPNEHFYYWTQQGFIAWMALYRFRCLEISRFETEAGRDDITSFAFIRDLPGYNETLEQYQRLHSLAYGTSAYLHFDRIAKEVLRLNPRSILDFGCGRSDLVGYFWKDGMRRVEKYDPAIPQFKRMPKGRFDLVLCTDVMEHIPMTDVGRIFDEISAKSRKVIFTISMKPARAKLPDGRNAHVTLLNAGEWMQWIKSVFKYAYPIKTEWDTELMVKTF